MSRPGTWRFSTAIVAGMALALISGCGSDGATPAGSSNQAGGTVASREQGDHDEHGDHNHGDEAEGNGHKHSGWWCNEHGIPEAVCSMCSADVAAQFQKKGDWCEEHNRAKSQCFICDPNLREKFAAQYRAKYGKEPPPIEEEEATEKGHEGT